MAMLERFMDRKYCKLFSKRLHHITGISAPSSEEVRGLARWLRSRGLSADEAAITTGMAWCNEGLVAPDIKLDVLAEWYDQLDEGRVRCQAVLDEIGQIDSHSTKDDAQAKQCIPSDVVGQTC